MRPPLGDGMSGDLTAIMATVMGWRWDGDAMKWRWRRRWQGESRKGARVKGRVWFALYEYE